MVLYGTAANVLGKTPYEKNALFPQSPSVGVVRSSVRHKDSGLTISGMI